MCWLICILISYNSPNKSHNTFTKHLIITEKAAQILDPLEMNPETEANWKTLSKIALEEQNINVSEHCYAALGDVGKALYLRKINKLIKTYEQETGK